MNKLILGFLMSVAWVLFLAASTLIVLFCIEGAGGFGIKTIGQLNEDVVVLRLNALGLERDVQLLNERFENHTHRFLTGEVVHEKEKIRIK